MALLQKAVFLQSSPWSRPNCWVKRARGGGEKGKGAGGTKKLSNGAFPLATKLALKYSALSHLLEFSQSKPKAQCCVPGVCWVLIVTLRLCLYTVYWKVCFQHLYRSHKMLMTIVVPKSSLVRKSKMFVGNKSSKIKEYTRLFSRSLDSRWMPALGGGKEAQTQDVVMNASSLACAFL